MLKALKNKFEMFRNIWLIWEVLRNHKTKTIIMLVVVACSAFLEGASYALVLPLLDSFVGSEGTGVWSNIIIATVKTLVTEKHVVLFLCIFVLFLLTLKIMSSLIKIAYVTYFTNGLMRSWIIKIKENYLYASYSFILNHKQGYLINSIINEPGRARNVVLSAINFVAKLVTVSILFVVLLCSNTQATIVFSVVMGILLLVTNRSIRNYSVKFGRERLAVSQELHSHVSENISALRQIKVFGLEIVFHKRFKASLYRYFKIVNLNTVIMALPSNIGEFVTGVLIVTLFIYLQYVLNYEPREMIPTAGLFILVVQRLRGYLSELVGLRMGFLNAMPSLVLVHNLIKNEQEKKRYQTGKNITGIDGDIVIRNMHFSYNKQKPVFVNLNLTIPHGKMTAIVGPTGSGKSTLVDLILGFYSLESGEILVNGKDLRDVNLHAWHRNIGYVSQDTFVFNTTISDNIAMGKLDAGQDEIVEAAKMAGVHDFVMDSPQQYLTVVGDRGMKLSGGQRQRIAIARALIRKPDLLIFDEATSALDTKTESKIQKSIEEMAKGKTVLIIAHRLSTIENADVVYDLSKMNEQLLVV